MTQIVLPLSHAATGPARIVLGQGNAHVADALAHPERWPFRTAVLTGPPRSGKSLFARWFAESGAGDVIDEGQAMDEAALFHRWNRAQEQGRPLLVVGGEPPWEIALADLKSRQLTLRCTAWLMPETAVVKVSTAWTPAEADAGGTPSESSKVFEMTPNAMPSAPSTICAAKPTAAKASSISRSTNERSIWCRRTVVVA
jgi:hypothetical protein